MNGLPQQLTRRIGMVREFIILHVILSLALLMVVVVTARQVSCRSGQLACINRDRLPVSRV